MNEGRAAQPGQLRTCLPGSRPGQPRVPRSGARAGVCSAEQVAPALDRFATVVPDEVWTELDAC